MTADRAKETTATLAVGRWFSLMGIWGLLSCVVLCSLASPLVERGASSAVSALRSDHQDLGRSAPNGLPSGWLPPADPWTPGCAIVLSDAYMAALAGIPLEQRTRSEKIRGVVVQAQRRGRRRNDSHGGRPGSWLALCDRCRFCPLRKSHYFTCTKKHARVFTRAGL